MNQILSVEMPKKGKNHGKQKASIRSIVVVFSIFLLLFGIGITSTAALSYYRSISGNYNNQLEISNKKPVITTEREDSSRINIVVSHDKEISKVTYTLNDDEPVKIDGEGKNEINEEVNLPVGSSKIKIVATDLNGISSSREEAFEVEQKPIIKLERADPQIQLTTESTINIDYVSYYWDEDTENVQKYTINDKKNVTLIDIPEGTHVLNILAVDIDGNEAKASQTVKGVVKPNIEVITDGENFIIKASDSSGINKIEIKFNSNDTIVEEINKEKQYEKEIVLENGINKIIVTVYNENGLSETTKVKYTKE